MRRIAILACTIVAVAAITSPALAGPHVRLVHRADALHSQVQQKLGERAPGRNIAREGVRSRGHSRPATNTEVRTFIGRLRYMLNPPPAPVAAPVVTTAAPPSTSSGGGGGTYCGAYQFDQQTWQSVGGTGTACGASPAEQDRRATILMEQRGTSPWPNCGSASLAAIRQCENSGSYAP